MWGCSKVREFKPGAFSSSREWEDQDFCSPVLPLSNTHIHVVSLLTPLFKEQALSLATPPVQASMTPFQGFCNTPQLFSGASPSHHRPAGVVFLKQSWLHHSTASNDLMAFHYSGVKWASCGHGAPGWSQFPPDTPLSLLTSRCKCHNYWLALPLRHRYVNFQMPFSWRGIFSTHSASFLLLLSPIDSWLTHQF